MKHRIRFLLILLFSTLLLAQNNRELSTVAKGTFSDTSITILSQYGIDWHIKGQPQYGQYTNGEYWVVGPITLIKITPQSFKYNMQTLPDGSALPNGVEGHNIDRIINGSMVNPSVAVDAYGNVTYEHGYDDELSLWKPTSGSYPERIANYAPNKKFYKEALNIARIDTGNGNYAPISEKHPRLVQPNSSIVSTISAEIPDRPVLEVSAILTVVEKTSKPKEGDFRPPYCGADKKSYHHISDLDYSALKSLQRAENFLSLEEAEGFFERNWLDYIPEWIGEFTHAKQNMRKSYGADLASMVSSGALALNTEYGSGTTDKKLLLKRMVQLGIDYYGVVTQPWGWRVYRNNGGHLTGRKFPILLAGKALNNDAMLNLSINHPKIHFGEDDQTFYVRESDIEVTNGSSWNPDARDKVRMAYKTSDLGLPEWGIVHASAPGRTNKYWETAYRRCCTHSSMQGAVLAAYAMELKENWAHNALFDYMDRYLSIEKQIYFTGVDDPNIIQNKSAIYGRAPTDFFNNIYGMYNMWVLHRESFGAVWKRNDGADLYSNGGVEGENKAPQWLSSFPNALTVTAEAPVSLKMSDYVADAETSFNDLVFTISTIDSLAYHWKNDSLFFFTTATNYKNAGMVYLEAEDEESITAKDSVWIAINPTSGIAEKSGVIRQFKLEQNYPNPFNPKTMIRYKLPMASNVKLEIYDALGKKVRTLVNEKRAAGEHTFLFDASSLASGVYIYRLTTGSFTQMQKMVLIK
jgi:hypothetical protein